jgi:hypothetical protein
MSSKEAAFAKRDRDVREWTTHSAIRVMLLVARLEIRQAVECTSVLWVSGF